MDKQIVTELLQKDLAIEMLVGALMVVLYKNGDLTTQKHLKMAMDTYKDLLCEFGFSEDQSLIVQKFEAFIESSND